MLICTSNKNLELYYVQSLSRPFYPCPVRIIFFLLIILSLEKLSHPLPRKKESNIYIFCRNHMTFIHIFNKIEPIYTEWKDFFSEILIYNKPFFLQISIIDRYLYFPRIDILPFSSIHLHKPGRYIKWRRTRTTKSATTSSRRC